MSTHYIVDSNPDSKESVVACPLCTCRLWSEKLLELGDLIDDRPDPLVLDFLPEPNLETFTHKTVGRYGVTSFASIVAPPEARLKNLVPATLYVLARSFQIAPIMS